MLRIEKFVGDKRETTLRVPDFVVSLASALLPESAHVSLAERGLRLRDIAVARKEGAPYLASTTVCEHGVSKKIVISLT
ncbi:MAG: hypothetical protein P4L87_03945 [Formivibrio sp.]|nr:hypothetical protein [Formivibrio sp.]